MEELQVRKSLNEKIGDFLVGTNDRSEIYGFAAGAIIGGSLSSPFGILWGVPAGLASRIWLGKNYATDRKLYDSDQEVRIKTSLSGYITDKLYGREGAYSIPFGAGAGAIIGGSLFGLPGIFVGGAAAGLANGLMNYKMFRGTARGL